MPEGTWVMFDARDFVTFIGAATILVVVPGPATMVILAQSLDGRTRGLATVAGIETGTLIHTIAAAAGLSALIAASALAFDVVKFCGAGYLLIAGVRTIAQRAVTVKAEPELTVRAAYRRGVFTNVLNPKTALFFLAFLPHFIRADRGHVFLQCIVLGGTLSAVGVVVGSAYALTAVLVGEWLREHSQFDRWQQRVSGALLIAIGLRLMFVSRH